MSIIPNSYIVSVGERGLHPHFSWQFFPPTNFFIFISRRRFFFARVRSLVSRILWQVAGKRTPAIYLLCFARQRGNVGRKAEGLAHIPGLEVSLSTNLVSQSINLLVCCRKQSMELTYVYTCIYRSPTFGRFLSFAVVVRSPSENSLVNRESRIKNLMIALKLEMCCQLSWTCRMLQRDH